MEEVERPIPRAGELLVKVYAVSVNDWDWGLLCGRLTVNRVLNGLLRPKRHILGSDIAGRVEAVGPGVSRFQPGEAVFGDLSGSWGGFAEYVCASETAVVRKPDSMDWEEAAAIPQAAALAFQALHSGGEIRPGQSILINGAGGGVGTFAVQMMKSDGVEVTGVDSAEKLKPLSDLGFDHVIDYQTDDFTRGEQRYDVILDVKMNRSVFAYLRVLAPGGRYVTIGGAMARVMQAAVLGPLINVVSRKSVRLLPFKPNQGLREIVLMCEEGMVRPAIDKPIWNLNQAPEAMRRFGAAQQFGKVVIRVSPEQ